MYLNRPLPVDSIEMKPHGFVCRTSRTGYIYIENFHVRKKNTCPSCESERLIAGRCQVLFFKKKRKKFFLTFLFIYLLADDVDNVNLSKPTDKLRYRERHLIDYATNFIPRLISFSAVTFSYFSDSIPIICNRIPSI